MTSLESMSFEEALKELEGIVRSLEEGKTNLEDAIQAYERGAKLRGLCEKKLQNAKLRIEKIMVGPSGETVVEPLLFDE